jgi:uncharacterized repeat protein (TIGR03803 family)
MSKIKWATKACGVFLLWATTAVALPAQTFTTLHSFNGSTEGNFPKDAPVQGTDGNLYGTVYGGGTIFKITPGGALTILNSADGSPVGGLVQATNGDFYGTTDHGGTSNTCPKYFIGGCGTVFKITPGGTVTTLLSFDYTDGANSFAGLIQGTDGNLYGTTEEGGANSKTCEGYSGNGCGTVFKITPGGTLTTLHSFDGTDGAVVDAGLVQGSDGNFYGTTVRGGVPSDDGTVFTITANGSFATIYTFSANGIEPTGVLVQGTDGNYYGTTFIGGTHDYGTIFKIRPSGELTTLHSFDSTDGAYPGGGVIRASDGNFYGTTVEGGANGAECNESGCGTIFKMTPGGTLTTLYSFCQQVTNGVCTDGAEPAAGLVQATDGSFYGTTEFGGACTFYFEGCGTLFSLSVGLKPFVETQPTSGKVGAPVKILGTNLTGATSVTFNGTAAVFTVASKTLITTTVPAGATTGTVQVVRPNGKGSSNVPFTVLP